MTSKQNELLIKQYEGNEVAFDPRTTFVKVNATEMAKPYGREKRPQQFLRTKETQEYIQALSVAHKCATTDLVTVKQGGKAHEQGTWMHELLALRYAQWLSPYFSIWVDMQIREILMQKAISSHLPTWNGLQTVLRDDVNYVAYREALQVSGYSTSSGSVGKRKKQFPQFFALMFGRNFITVAFAERLLNQKHDQQLELPLQHKTIGGTTV